LRDFLAVDMPPRPYCLAILRKAAFNKGRSRGERAYCSALRRAWDGIFEWVRLFWALVVRARSLFVDLIDGLTPSAPVWCNLCRGRL